MLFPARGGVFEWRKPPCEQSGRRGSNSRHSAWKAEALPTELLPLETALIERPRRPKRGTGGGCWIRTNVGISRRIYSPLPLATRAILRNVCSVMERITLFSKCQPENQLTGWRGRRTSFVPGPRSDPAPTTGVFDAELARGLEPLTPCLQNRCSTN